MKQSFFAEAVDLWNVLTEEQLATLSTADNIEAGTPPPVFLINFDVTDRDFALINL